MWRLQRDVPDPYGDKRGSRVASSWIVDLDNGLLTLRKKVEQFFRIGLHEIQNNAAMDVFQPIPF